MDTTKAPNREAKSTKQLRSSLRTKSSPCRPAAGAYPKINRGVLAKLTQSSKGGVCLILRGLREPRMTLATKMAAEIGVTVEEMLKEIKKANQDKANQGNTDAVTK